MRKNLLLEAYGQNPLLEAYAQNPLLEAHADAFSRTRNLKFDLSLHLHPYFGYASSEGYDESVHMHRLVLTFPSQ